MYLYILPNEDSINLTELIVDKKDCNGSDQNNEFSEQNDGSEYQKLKKIAVKLEETKDKLDKYYTDSNQAKNFNKVLRCFDHFREDKYKISKDSNGQMVTNSWLKFWELISEFKLIPKKKKISQEVQSFDDIQEESEFTVLCNSNTPGADLLAINHYIHTKSNFKEYNWTVLLGKNVDTEYKLLKNYQDNHILNIDVTDKKCQDLLRERLHRNVDLYTSDIGVELSQDYNKQEDLHCKDNLGQIVTGLLTLKYGGSMIFKQYTFFSDFSISLIYILTFLFTNVYICKPDTSKKTNSETYIVCTNFIEQDNKLLENYLLDRLDNFNNSSLINMTSISEDFLEEIVRASDKIFTLQMKYLESAISHYEKAYSDDNVCTKQKGNIFTEKYKVEITTLTGEKQILQDWNINHKVKKLNDKKKLNID